ncbi:26S proteasome non-ATPase regulatory subunit 5 [Neodiprion pinetum]|uniref:26S proteasome non-ATPase regulatory subunit 5 n=1 Tax=Neodiprion pinetum TaxID=441929 RepID=UPI001EDE657A|nr:26S proteasome non-ATPase regulatory subunit 5 [Neodiprion pinetum]
MTQVIELICQLPGMSDGDKKRSILKEIKNKLDSLNDDDLKLVGHGVSYNLLLADSFSNDSKTNELFCDVLHILFNTLEIGEVYEKYHEAISKAVQLKDPSIKSLTMREFLRTTNDPNKVTEMQKDFCVIGAILKSLGNKDLKISQMAATILKRIAHNATGLKILLTQFHNDLIQLMSKSSTVTYRVLDLMVDLSSASTEGFKACEDAGFLNRLVALISDNETLSQLNALELLTKLALSAEGLAYLERRHVLKHLAFKVARAEQDPLTSLLVPGLIKFFGNVAQRNPNDIFSKYPVVINTLFEVINTHNLTILPIALDTLGYIAKGAEGKYSLESLGEPMLTALRNIGKTVAELPSNIKVRALNCLGQIIRVQEEEQDNRILSLTKSWFDLLDDNPLDLIVKFCKQPFPDIRKAGFEVLGAVASQTWGQEYIANAPRLVEFLLDRNVETFKECKEVKHEVVKALSVASSDIFDFRTMQRLKAFVNQGPIYVETTMDIDIEGAS